MSGKLGIIEFFAMEAGEYLEQLDGLLARAQDTPGDDFPRLARALRGAALMANQQPIADAALAFEHLARAVHTGSRPFDPDTRQLAVRAVDDLKVLVRGARAWSDELQARAVGLADQLDKVVGRVSAPRVSGAQRGPDAGTRAFVAREGATLATALDRAAKLMRQQPGGGALQPVSQALQPLRGVAGLADLPPMGELLDGIERAVAEGNRPDRADAAAAVLDAAARTLTGATRAIATAGKADPDGPDVRDFASALARLLDFDLPVVPIDHLFHDDGGPHIVTEGAAPARPRLGDVELVSHGEHLRQVADALDRMDSPTRRALRAYGLGGTFRALERAAGPVGESALHFTTAARNAVAAGYPADRAAELATALRKAGTALASAASGQITAVTAGLVEAAQLLGAAAPATPAPAAPTPPMAAPAASTAPAPPPAPAPTRAPSAEPDGDESADLAGSYTRYHRYLDALGLGEPSLDELLSGPPADPRRATPVAAAASPEPADGVVPIETLLYDPDAALTRARALRQEAATALAGGDHQRANTLLEEVLDLVQIGLK